MQHDRILAEVGAYYGAQLRAHGATARGVDWSSESSQRLRFEQLLRICDRPAPYRLLDYGCGYGALMELLGPAVDYVGFDIEPDMIAEARRRYPTATFETDRSRLAPADFCVASGIFNVRLRTEEPAWAAYVLDCIRDLDALSQRGFAFNMLTSYSEAEKMRADLYYGDPSYYFDHCKRRYSKQVALLHDYGLYEFTILVRKA
jgi:SAM-dependent methyltransferase